MDFQTNIPFRGQWDVVVVGAGTAGVFAAISAARTGAKTLLIEKNGMPGGTMTAANVNFPGLFFAWGKQIIDGPCWEAIKRCEALGGAVIPRMQYKPERHWHEQILLNRFLYTAVLEQLLAEADVTVLLHTMLSAAEETDDGITVICTGKEGLWAASGAALVDATGDADTTGMLGYRREARAACQPATLMNHIRGYSIAQLDRDTVMRLHREAVAAGALQPFDFQYGDPYGALVNETIKMHIPCTGAADSTAKTTLEQTARATMLRMYRFLKSIPGLEQLEVDSVAEECGVRESYRIIGEKQITAQDYLRGTVYDDAICYCFYPIDLHTEEGISQQFLKEGVVPAIPYGALIPKNSKRIIAAGRCAAGDADANSAYRVQAACMAMGQAAGAAAALLSKTAGRAIDLPIQNIRTALHALGAIVPE